MKRWIFSLPLVLLLLSASFPALAAEGEAVAPTPEPITVEAEADDKNIVVNVTLPSVAAPTPTEPTEEAPVETMPTFTPYSISALDEVPVSGDTLTDTVTVLFGPYTPRTQTITEYLADGTTATYQQVIPGVAGLDWPWITSVGLFALLLYGLLRLLGGLMKL